MKTKSLFWSLCLIIIAGELLYVSPSYSQSPQFRIPLVMIDSVFDSPRILRKVVRDTVFIGIHPSATYCHDNFLLTGFQDHWFYSIANVVDTQTVWEKLLPPKPPEGVFDFRLNNTTPRSACLDQGVKNNIHLYSGPAQIDTFRLIYQTDNSGPVSELTLVWPTVLSEYCNAMTLVGGTVNLDMFTQTNVTFTVDDASTLRIYMTGPKIPPPPPAAIELVSPVNGALDQELSLPLVWKSLPGAFYYRLNVAIDPGFSRMVLDTILTDTTKMLAGLRGDSSYYWRVYTENEYGVSFFQKPPFTFRTLAGKPAVPSLLSPVNNETNISLFPLLLWRKVESGMPVTYRIQLSTNTDFSTIVKDTVTSDTAWQTGPLQNCLRYYWRASAINQNGTSDWSAIYNFKTVLTTPAIPALQNPPDGAAGVPLAPTLSWSANDNCSESYRLQVKKDTNSADVVLDAVQSQNSIVLSALDELTDYYWRVKSINGFDSSQFTSFRKFKTLLNPPAAPVLLSPPDGDQDQEQSVTLIWQSSLHADSYHVQAATDQAFTSLILSDTSIADTFRTVNSLTNCVLYYWRVRCKNESGWGDYSNVRNFKVKPVPPLTPSLVSPVNNAIGIILSPTLSWTAADICSYNFRLEVAFDVQFSFRVVNLITSQTSATIGPLLLDTVYYWRVKSLNPVDSSAFTSYWEFRTVQQPPPAPQLVSPLCGDTTVETSASLVWRKAPYADDYRLQIASDQSFTPSSLIVDEPSLADTSYIPSFLKNCSWYYWRISASNGAGASPYSSACSFRVRTVLPGPPSLIYPANNQDSLSETVRLIWSRGDLCTHRYYYQVSRNSGFTDLVASGETGDTTLLVGPLAGNVYYYWHVRAVNYLGEGGFSPTYLFHTTRSRPSAPVLLSPPDGSADLPGILTLQWDSAAFAQTYRLQVALDAGFTNLKINDSTIAQQSGVRPSKTVSGLLNSTTYYWRVNAKNEIGYSSWSSIWQFSTMYPPAPPPLNRPYNYADDVPVNPQFDWSIAAGADIYELQVSEDQIFSKILFDDSTISVLNWQISYTLKGLTKYYWRVRGKNSVGWGQWSQIFEFTTSRTGFADWLIPLTVKETGPAVSTIYFGVHPGATSGVDPSLGEYTLPPVDPWYFDARFVSPYIGEGLLVSIVKFRYYSQVDTFEFTFKPGLGGYPIKISWPRELVRTICDSMVIKDQLIAPNIRSRMDIDSAISVNTSSVRSMYIVVHGAFPLPVDVKPIRPPLPEGFVLYQNYPNPFNPATHISFSIDRSAKIQVKIFDMLGREVITMADATFFPGVHTFDWDGRDETGVTVPSGVYYVRMTAQGSSVQDEGNNHRYVSTRKMIMLK